ncbi:NAD-binding protein [Pseudonocardia benzenivorans]
MGAAAEPLARARPVLDRLASTLAVVGERPGDGQAMKTVNQLLAGVHIAAAAEAVALARAFGLDAETVVATLSAGAAGSFMLADRGPGWPRPTASTPTRSRSGRGWTSSSRTWASSPTRAAPPASRCRSPPRATALPARAHRGDGRPR